ncbi:MAG TPA: hypothetical protein VHO25_20190 [Polyangiaceae bacterium]|nr:hypothetical protein [Polyangiaceae bacterium]
MKIFRGDGQWIADVPKAPELIAWSSSLARLRGHVEAGLKLLHPELAKVQLRVAIQLPPSERALLRRIEAAERRADVARRRASAIKRQASRQLQARLGISIREVGILLGVSGARAQQLLKNG